MKQLVIITALLIGISLGFTGELHDLLLSKVGEFMGYLSDSHTSSDFSAKWVKP